MPAPSYLSKTIAFTSGLALLAGCQTYQPAPVDLAAHQELWSARDPGAPGVAAFAKELASAEEPSQPFDLADGVSVAEAEAVGLFFNPDLRQARMRAAVALAGAENAGLWEDPVLGVDAERIVESVSHPWVVASMLSVTLPVSGRLEAEKAQAGAEHGAELRRVAAAEWATRTAIRTAWAEWSAQMLRTEIDGEFLGQVDRLLSRVEPLAAAGELSRSEFRLFQIERATRAGELRLLRSRAGGTEILLRGLLGLTPHAPVRLVPRLDTVPRGAATERGDPSRIAETSPILAVARAEYEVAERALAAQIRAQYPDITIGSGYGREDGEDRVLFGLSLPIPLLNRNQRGIAVASAERESARVALEATYERLVGAVAAAETELAGARLQAETLEAEIVPLADQQYADVERLADAGEVDTLLLLESLSRQREAKLALVEARLAETLAAVRLADLLGPGPRPIPAVMENRP